MEPQKPSGGYKTYEKGIKKEFERNHNDQVKNGR